MTVNNRGRRERRVLQRATIPENVHASPAGAQQLSMLHRMVYRLYYCLISRVRTSGPICRCLFGFRPCLTSDQCGDYWDWSTLVLRKALRLYLRHGMSLLDVGTGTVGVLAVFGKLNKDCRQVVGIDKVPEVISLARTNAQRLHLDIDFYCSDLFSNVTGRFDLVIFNAPYLDAENGRQLNVLRSPLHEERFCGGHGERGTIARFLRQVPAHLSDGGTAVLAVNHYHIGRDEIAKLIAASSGLRLVERLEGRLLPATAYVFCRSDSMWKE